MRNWDLYYNRMGKNTPEKADFIMDELRSDDYDNVIDYGCADGRLTEFLAVHFPRINFYGIDFKEVIDRVIDKWQSNKWNPKNLHFMNKKQFDSVCAKNHNSMMNKRTLVIFSSVIHEMGTNEFLDLFKERFYKVGAIAIRDMRGTFKNEIAREKAQKLIVDTLFEEHREEEMAERYYGVDWWLINLIVSNINLGFQMVYKDYYANEYLMENVEGLKELTKRTHCKVIYKRLD